MKSIIFSLMMLCGMMSHAACLVYQKDSVLVKGLNDPLFSLLSHESICPESIQSFKRVLSNHGLESHISMVANRGRNNPALGSFSFFEWVTGKLDNGQEIRASDLFFGHFTDSLHGTLVLDQRPAKNKLLIELIAWDSDKGLYNFYEMRGLDDRSTRWYYRGDSRDALLDNRLLYRGSSNKAQFGQRMRCSACHSSGGPIMKELSLPHNDWWGSQRGLPLGPNLPDRDIKDQLTQLSDATALAKVVRVGMKSLLQSERFKKIQQTLSLQERLRPLFCTTEINLASEPEGVTDKVQIPTEFWLNPLLGQLDISLPRQSYKALIRQRGLHFPEGDALDADHAWLTPVKGYADIKAIQALIQEGVVSEQFALSVLMIDYQQPIFSAKRCGLLQLVPREDSMQWQAEFKTHLKASQQPWARKLYDYLTLPFYHHEKFRRMIDSYRQQVQTQMAEYHGQEEALDTLIKRRQAVFDSEISKNPLGQILEPGFRVIFPVPVSQKAG